MFFPSFIQVPLRRLSGQRIGKGSRIRFGTLLIAQEVNLGQGVSLGPFCLIRAEKLTLADYSMVKTLSLVSTRIVSFGKYVHIAPLSIILSEFTENSRIEIGDHSRVFPFSWMDTGEGISIGKQTSVGTHTLIYSHGTWPDYLKGGAVTFGPVVVGDEVYLATRITILPNVVIGNNTIVGSSSFVNKSFPDNVMIGGTPARIIKENLATALDPAQKLAKANEILLGFKNYMEFKYKIAVQGQPGQLRFDTGKIIIDDVSTLQAGDLLFLVNTHLTADQLKNFKERKISVLDHQEKQIWLGGKDRGGHQVVTNFISFIRRYGVRLYINK